MHAQPVDSLPLFAHADGSSDPAFRLPPLAWNPGTKPTPRGKRPPPPADEIWAGRPTDCTADMARAAFVRAARDLRDPPKPVIDPLAAAVLACPHITRAIGRPDLSPITKQFQSALWVERLADRVSVSLAYRGPDPDRPAPKSDLVDAVEQLGRIARGLGMIARTTTAQFLPLRADTAKQGEIGWLVKVPLVPAAHMPRGAIRRPESAMTL